MFLYRYRTSNVYPLVQNSALGDGIGGGNVGCVWREAKVVCCCFFKISFIFRERGREVEREGEKHQCVVAPTGDLAHIPGICPDWELNW